MLHVGKFPMQRIARCGAWDRNLRWRCMSVTMAHPSRGSIHSTVHKRDYRPCRSCSRPRIETVQLADAVGDGTAVLRTVMPRLFGEYAERLNSELQGSAAPARRPAPRFQSTTGKVATNRPSCDK